MPQPSGASNDGEWLIPSFEHVRPIGVHIGGRAQAAASSFGGGRIPVAGEAAIFSEQLLPTADGLGLSYDDQQLVLSLVHRLSRLT